MNGLERGMTSFEQRIQQIQRDNSFNRAPSFFEQLRGPHIIIRRSKLSELVPTPAEIKATEALIQETRRLLGEGP